MNDETLALTVSEATMQDWQAAVTLMKQSPMSFCMASLPAPHPVLRRPAVVRVTRTAPPHCDAARHRPAAAEDPARVGGARTVYWVALAAALAVMAVL
ncbi:MAG TPA: hypothetical protein PLE54_13385 [Burkholderiaceae bacterium]|nr:hypothetical protein [Burkholderiaceae bacterium]HQR71595.1 hypothetical protein [Burkholderiaceae bacterium]